jgi:UDP-sulfoquinovose synthase
MEKFRMKSSTVVVFGGDGFCGWPTCLKLAADGYKVVLVDNLSRRAIDNELSSSSLTNIASIKDRVRVANELVGNIVFEFLDVATDANGVIALLKKYRPTAVVQFAEQRAAPYSMIGDAERRYTVDNNVSGTHNICSAIVEVDLNIHLVHLGTMGVYGYSKVFGAIPEGYLDVKINSTEKNTEILYPANPGSVYHLTKCLDQLLFQFYNKNWGLKITDLHQGIVWGVETEHTKLAPELVNRFDYDGIYGTVLNRFISQAANAIPLTVYGTGGQTRAFIHISDTAKCVQFPSRMQVFLSFLSLPSPKIYHFCKNNL